MKLLSWNVNGIRAILKKNFMDFVNKEKPDVLCIQETKAGKDNIQILLPDYEQFWYSAERPGYSGTLVLTKHPPLSVQYGLAHDDHDSEGRVIAVEFEDFFLVNVYTPNAGSELARLPYRQEWDEEFRAFIKKLDKNKPVIICGDLNVAHTEIDLARPKQNVGNAGFTPEERAGIQKHLDAGFIDTFRVFNKEPGHYSWWSYRAAARAKDIGWRIDYFLCSERLKPRLTRAWILKDVLGSDHCPVGIELKK